MTSETDSDSDTCRLLGKAPPANLEQCFETLRVSNSHEASPSKLAVEKQYWWLPCTVIDAQGDKPFLACPYNQVAIGATKHTGHRSPWTNKVHSIQPPEGQSTENEASSSLRPLEITLNEIWDTYKHLYYGHAAVGSVFLKEREGSAFEGMFGIHKECSVGTWRSLSRIVVSHPDTDGACEYAVDTTVHLVLHPTVEVESQTNAKAEAIVSSLVSKAIKKRFQVSKAKLPLNVCHIENLGSLIETNEIDLRSSLEKVLIPKNQETIDVLQRKHLASSHRPQVNPLAGMMMESDILKKKKLSQMES